MRKERIKNAVKTGIYGALTVGTYKGMIWIVDTTNTKLNTVTEQTNLAQNTLDYLLTQDEPITRENLNQLQQQIEQAKEVYSANDSIQSLQYLSLKLELAAHKSTTQPEFKQDVLHARDVFFGSKTMEKDYLTDAGAGAIMVGGVVGLMCAYQTISKGYRALFPKKEEEQK